MGTSNSVVRPPRNPVPEGKTRICVAGYKISPFTGRARATAAAIVADLPDQYETWFYFDTSANYFAFLKETFDPVPFPDHLKGHASSPFVWLERGATNEITPIGGNSHLSEWVLAQPELAAIESVKKLASGSGIWGPMFHNGESAPQSTADITPSDSDSAPATTEEATPAAAKKAEEEAAAAKKAEEEAAAAAKKAEEEAAAAKKAEEAAAAAKKAEEEAAAAAAEAAKKAEEAAAAEAAKKAEEEQEAAAEPTTEEAPAEATEEATTTDAAE